ncbi:aminotransferase class I/II-fold pyridoxal phosphate-dependent enzyme [Paenibacillus cucumis (ex Kampfer et al. 2016)]|uniref:Aminotransferase class I/II-fold pyridoxal phosphate-dependent enzyme n=1 Tax=Paenibacillus cucumis (ex Kampfer et al. 2016) TaxID=1776858 RepID=A0ABS7KJ77_9BACL|nr:aminotransferase class I/II-fold pyridoxal phosphate-dependent enzyme [Paenibacillus cucumis (ex Kampfer et al. 2016)]MBY0204141.1 aminotransferase class I/II-fold pyridoxal phosphate-dependent enzyme [Paenibacillus cucumis (ex Kampfer et al. 2016)]
MNEHNTSGVGKKRAPLYEALLAYRDSKQRSFHVPGHKNGQVYHQWMNQSEGTEDALQKGIVDHTETGDILGREQRRQEENVKEGEQTVFSADYSLKDTDQSRHVVPVRAYLDMMEMDVTEITGTDDLHHPEGVIKEAQDLASDCFGAEESFFLVGGSTAGNLSLLLTICDEPGSIVLVQRNVHKSVIHGLMLAGARAVFLEPWVDPESGLAVMPSIETVQAAVQMYPEAKGVFVTLPNYYGMGADLTPIAEVCHEAGMPLLVDEAHGAHYGQHPELPVSALSCGADGVVQSTHKMLAAFTMGAMLHIQGPRLNRSLLRQRLAMVQSSSPSYPVMASLDLSRRLLHVHGADAFTAGLAAVKALKRGLAELPRFQLLQPADSLQQEPAYGNENPAAMPGRQGYTAQDPFKVVIYDDTGILSGYELQQQLEACGCVPEMSDERYVVLLFSLGSTLQDAEHVLQALRHINVSYKLQHSLESTASVRTASQTQTDPPIYVSTWNNIEDRERLSEPVAFSLQPIIERDTIGVPIEDCAGYRSAEMVIPYPPGIPLVYPGERISSKIAERIRILRDGGAKFQGISDHMYQKIKVMKPES